jgi:hypothetical protein
LLSRGIARLCFRDSFGAILRFPQGEMEREFFIEFALELVAFREGPQS